MFDTFLEITSSCESELGTVFSFLALTFVVSTTFWLIVMQQKPEQERRPVLIDKGVNVTRRQWELIESKPEARQNAISPVANG